MLFWHVEVVAVLGEGEEVQRDVLLAVEVERGAAVLDAPPEDADGVVADVAAGRRRVDDDRVAAAQLGQRDRRVGGVAARSAARQPGGLRVRASSSSRAIVSIWSM